MDNIDVIEQHITDRNMELLKILLKDKTTGKFIKWATDNYISFGESYNPEDEIHPEQIIGKLTNTIKPRVTKSIKEQLKRTRDKAEVFTPTWIINQQNNLVDEAWFCRKDIFNIDTGTTWETILDKIKFPEGKTWEEYVCLKRLEISCGEAPYLVSRYDAVSGEVIPVANRVGLLDRKLRVINENIDNEIEWNIWVIKAFQSSYGYEYQGDNLLIARENLLYTYCDNFYYKFGKYPTLIEQKKIANIITWNVWQMDGIIMNVPYNTRKKEDKVAAIPCRIFDWSSNQTIEFKSIMNGNAVMKFNAIVGNPPYQKMDGGNGVSASPVYNFFVEQAKAINPNYLSMIIPARWYVGGKGLNKFRSEMLSDTHISKLVDFPNCNNVFPSVDIAGGLCYFLWDKSNSDVCEVVNYVNGQKDFSSRNLNEYDVFIRSNKGLSIVKKVLEQHDGKCMNEVVSVRKPFGIPTNYKPQENGIPCWFIKKIGLKYARKEDVNDIRDFLNKWKLLAPKSPIAGQTDFTKPVGFYYDGNTIVAKPGECCTESFIILYAANTKEEVESFKSYLFTKIVRFLLLQCVASQDITREKYRFVPDLNNYKIMYTDDILRKRWNINDEEWVYIDSRIKNIER